MVVPKPWISISATRCAHSSSVSRCVSTHVSLTSGCIAEAVSASKLTTAEVLAADLLSDTDDGREWEDRRLKVLDLRENNLGPMSLSMLVEMHAVVLV